MNKKLILAIVLSLGGMAASAQAEAPVGGDRPAVAVTDSLLAVEARYAVEACDFVIEANRITLKNGRTEFVSSSTNFVSLSGGMATIQVAPFQSNGPNGVGGITLEGRASNVKVTTDKSGQVTLTMSVFGTGLSATVTVTLPRDGYQASVLINSNHDSGRITLHGILRPSDRADVFKGRSL